MSGWWPPVPSVTAVYDRRPKLVGTARCKGLLKYTWVQGTTLVFQQSLAAFKNGGLGTDIRERRPTERQDP